MTRWSVSHLPTEDILNAEQRVIECCLSGKLTIIVLSGRTRTHLAAGDVATELGAEQRPIVGS